MVFDHGNMVFIAVFAIIILIIILIRINLTIFSLFDKATLMLELERCKGNNLAKFVVLVTFSAYLHEGKL